MVREAHSAKSAEVRKCPLCGLVMAFSDGDDGTQPTCNPLRSPDCWTVTARLKDGKQYPVNADGRASRRSLASAQTEVKS